MKKAKILSLLLAVVMLLSLLPAVGLTASALTETEKPTKLPNGKTIASTTTWVDWDSVTSPTHGSVSNSVYTFTKSVIASNDNDWGLVGEEISTPNNTAWQGASGIMFYMDPGSNNDVNYGFKINAKYDNGNADACFVNSSIVNPGPKKNLKQGDANAVSYWYNATTGAWKECSEIDPKSSYINHGYSTHGAGWYYIPFSSFYYSGSDSKGNSSDKLLGYYDFQTFMKNYPGFLNGVTFLSTTANVEFGNISFVTAGSSVANDKTVEPDALPNGIPFVKDTWIQWSTVTDTMSRGTVNTTASTYTVTNPMSAPATSSNSEGWGLGGDKATVHSTAWKDAYGIMFYMDPGDNQTVDYGIRIEANGMRDGEYTNANFVNSAIVNPSTIKKLKADADSVSYWYDTETGSWEECSFHLIKSSYIEYGYSTYGAGWYYIPFTSFYYSGAQSKGDSTTDAALGYCNFYDFMSFFPNKELNGVFLMSTTNGVTFGDVYFVNPDMKDHSFGSSSTPAFGSNTVQASVKDSATADITNQSITIHQNTEGTANSLTSSVKEVTLTDNGGQIGRFAGATGLRFQVDTSALGAAQLQLRIRLQMNSQTIEINNCKAYKDGSNESTSLSTTAYPEYVARLANSILYYKGVDATGNPVSGSLENISDTDVEGDLFAALPVGFVGEIYIPMDSFGVAFGEHNAEYILPQRHITDDDSLKLWGIMISSAYTTELSEVAEDSVTYSNFEFTYYSTAVNGASVTVENDLKLNFYVNQAAGAKDASLTYSFGDIQDQPVALNADGTTTVVPVSILPQQMAEKVTVKFNATYSVGQTNRTLTQTMEYSIVDYCNKLKQDEMLSGNLLTLVADMLNYGAAAQKIAGGAAITTIAGGTTVTERTATVAKNLTTSTDAGKSFKSAAIRLESAVALRLNLNLDTTENVTVKVTLNGREQTFTGDELAAKTILYTDIKATEYDDAITATISVGGVVKQTLTYSVNTYLAALNPDDADMDALANAVWAYGQSASAYAAAPNAGN